MRPYVTTTWILLSGFLLSLVVLLAVDPICDSLQQQRLEARVVTHIQHVTLGARKRIQAIAELPDQLPDGPLTKSQFEQIAANLMKTPGIFCVEWCPQVPASQHEEVRQQLSERLQRDVQLMEYRNGRTVVVQDEKVVRPTFYVYPDEKKTQNQLGIHRGGGWRERTFALRNRGQVFVTHGNLWYGQDHVRPAALVAAPVRKKSKKPRGHFFVAFEHLFAPMDEKTSETIVTVKDISKSDYKPHKASSKPHLTLQTVESTESGFVARQQIAGRLFEFSVRAASYGMFRPIWIPWSLFFFANLGATLLAFTYYQRESEELNLHNRELERQVNRRIALQRHLQTLLDLRDQERELIAHEIHDGFVQDVIGAQMFLESALHLIGDDDVRLKEQTTTAVSLLAQAIDEARKTIDCLKPRVVDEVGLIAAVEASVTDDQKKYGFETRFVYTQDFPRLPVMVERIVYRIVREAVNNSRQHSGKKNATVCVTAEGDTILLEVTDTGVGFDADSIGDDRFGLAGIRQRAEVLSGEALITTSEFGTRVAVQFPIRQSIAPGQPKNESLLLQN